MSKHREHRLSLKAGLNEPTTAPIEVPVEEQKKPTAGSKMPTDQDQIQHQEMPTDQFQEMPSPTAKQMAAVEEANAKRVVDQQRANEARAAAEDRPVENIMGLAAKGRDALLQGLRKHAQEAAPPPYVPPPMTDRQKSALQEEMEAGAKAVAKAEASRVHAGHPTLPPPKDSNEGLTVPVHRPNDFVPNLYSKDPAILK